MWFVGRRIFSMSGIIEGGGNTCESAAFSLTLASFHVSFVESSRRLSLIAWNGFLSRWGRRGRMDVGRCRRRLAEWTSSSYKISTESSSVLWFKSKPIDKMSSWSCRSGAIGGRSMFRLWISRPVVVRGFLDFLFPGAVMIILRRRFLLANGWWSAVFDASRNVCEFDANNCWWNDSWLVSLLLPSSSSASEEVCSEHWWLVSEASSSSRMSDCNDFEYQRNLDKISSMSWLTASKANSRVSSRPRNGTTSSSSSSSWWRSRYDW